MTSHLLGDLSASVLSKACWLDKDSRNLSANRCSVFDSVSASVEGGSVKSSFHFAPEHNDDDCFFLFSFDISMAADDWEMRIVAGDR